MHCRIFISSAYFQADGIFHAVPVKPVQELHGPVYIQDQTRDGSLWVVVIVKSCVNEQAGSWFATQEWTTNQEPGQQVEPTLDTYYNS